MCCDAKTKYVHNAEINCGREENSAALATHFRQQVVLSLLAPLSCEVCNVTTDNYFTSLQFSRDLLKKKMSLVGTIHTNRVEVPKELVDSKGRQLYSTLYGFNAKGDYDYIIQM